MYFKCHFCKVSTDIWYAMVEKYIRKTANFVSSITNSCSLLFNLLFILYVFIYIYFCIFPDILKLGIALKPLVTSPKMFNKKKLKTSPIICNVLHLTTTHTLNIKEMKIMLLISFQFCFRRKYFFKGILWSLCIAAQ